MSGKSPEIGVLELPDLHDNSAHTKNIYLCPSVLKLKILPLSALPIFHKPRIKNQLQSSAISLVESSSCSYDFEFHSPFVQYVYQISVA